MKRLLLTVTLLGFGCRSQIDEATLVGTYIANHGRGKDTLFVEPGGKYIHHFLGPSGKRFEDEGTWDFESDPAGNYNVVFTGFQHYWDEGARSNAIWPAYVQRSLFGKVRILLNEDLSYYYEKR